jgi:hypothetical protein
MAADERRSPEIPVDVDLDPAVRFAAGELSTGLVRVHPSFRFEDALASRLSAAAARLKAGLPVEEYLPLPAGVLAEFPSPAGHAAGATGAAGATSTAGAAGTAIRSTGPAAALRRLPERAGHPSRPLIVGGVGVGVASAALSLGAVYVAWRHSHPASGRMGRAARAAHGRTGHSSQHRRAGVINGILGVVS